MFEGTSLLCKIFYLMFALYNGVYCYLHSCELRQRCRIDMRDVRTSDPCVGTYKYLQTNFICLPKSSSCDFLLMLMPSSWPLPGRGRVIFVYGAYYGRRNRRTCSEGRPQSQVENVNCINPAQRVPQRQFCSIEASNSVFGDPCYGTYKYLEVAYVCICKCFYVSISQI
uniref:SUEL-type lectin domain-containing protein n=1 Tax=Oryzias sinensis TaxID=183150 RepID=A0A8C7WUJ0_9TELE